MHTRPRCREWMPLVTQQLRLRSLLQIQGINIIGAERSSLVYYTLHDDFDYPEFYRSEALSARLHQQKWAELNCAKTYKSNLNCVCVKVWEQRGNENCIVYNNLSNDKKVPPDKLLFSWGVYFSGLVLLNHQNLEQKCLPNSLIFKLNDNWFASPEHLALDVLREELTLSYQSYTSPSVPWASTATPTDSYAINSPKVSRSSSPVAFEISPQKCLEKDLLVMSKARYQEFLCGRYDVRNSYDLQTLLNLQQSQREQVQKCKQTLDIATEIRQKCVRCITSLDLAHANKRASLTSHHQHHHSMGRALSLLLAEQQRLDPETLLRTQELQQQIETLRCRQQTLRVERDTYARKTAQLRQKLTNCTNARRELQTRLSDQQQQLTAEREDLSRRSQHVVTLQERLQRVNLDMERRMCTLGMELREIYPVNRNQKAQYTVCGVPFPNVQAFLKDARYVPPQDPHAKPLALSVSLGYVAHLVQMISHIFNKPLRNPIRHEGSHSRIVDMVKYEAFESREYPLFSRSSMPTKPVKYAVLLLNQNIVQLCYDITRMCGDLNDTIGNILHIYRDFDKFDKQAELGSSKLDEVDSAISESNSSMELNSVVMLTAKLSPMTLLPVSMPMPIAERCGMSQQRISRSVGSYSDCDEDLKRENGYSNSDSNIQQS